MTLASRQDAALGPVRAAFGERAAEQAGQIVSDARAQAAALAGQAGRDAAAAIDLARADGVAEAEPVAAAEVARSRRRARAGALRAEEATRRTLISQITEAVLALSADPEYPKLLAGLRRLAERSAGPDAVIAEPPSGGVIARAAGLEVDLSLPRLAERAIGALSDRIAELCR